MSENLTPLDLKQCQCEITPAHNFMTLGPRRKPARCTNTPAYVLIERVQNQEECAGQMSVCEDCYMEFVRSDSGRSASSHPITRTFNVLVTFETIGPNSEQAAMMVQQYIDATRLSGVTITSVTEVKSSY